MSVSEFMSGPFNYRPAGRFAVNGKSRVKWVISYGDEYIAEVTLPADCTRSDIAEALGDHRAKWTMASRAEHEPELVQLINQETDSAVASFYSWAVPDMRPSLIDDRNPFWLRSKDQLRARPVTLTEYGHLVRQFAAPERAWVTGLLPDDVLTHDRSEWRAPTAWEIRHIVGQGSFTAATGAHAAEMVGVMPQNFRKYTAADDARSRQNMSFSMWHLLLHRLRVQSLPEE